MQKLKPSILKFVVGYRVWKIPENLSFRWIKSFLCIFRKTSGRKICLYSDVTPLVKVWGKSLYKQKIIKKIYRDHINHSDMVLLTLELKMVELSIFPCSGRTSISVFWKKILTSEQMDSIDFFCIKNKIHNKMASTVGGAPTFGRSTMAKAESPMQHFFLLK